MSKLNVSLSSLNQTPGDFENNKKNILDAAKKASKSKSTILVTPELSLSGYGLEDNFHSPYINEKCLIELHKLITSKEFPEDLYITVGLPFVHNNKIYNAVALISKNNFHGLTLKSVLASNGIHYENRWFTAWSKGETEIVDIKIDSSISYKNLTIGSPIYAIQKVKLAIEICEEAWVSERVSSKYQKQGVDIIINPSASHYAIDKFDTRKSLVAESSRVYGATYLYCNLNGCESGRAIYDGGNLVAQNGEIIREGERFHFTSESTMTVSIDTSKTKTHQFTDSQRHSLKAEHKKLINLNSFTDKISDINYGLVDDFSNEKLLNEIRKDQLLEVESTPPKSLSENEEIVRAVAIGLRDWSNKTNTNGYTLSLSGGADSSLCAVLVYLSCYFELEELSTKGIPVNKSYFSKFIKNDCKDRKFEDTVREIMQSYLVTAYQPSENSSQTTNDAAIAVANAIHSSHHICNIAEVVHKYETIVSESIGREINWKDDDIVKQNIQARTRSPLIWMFANLENKLLITTSNLSEASTGYFTQDGDSSGCLAPIAGLTKSRVLKILKYLEDKLPVLNCINQQKPTAELRSSEQNDEDELMPFSVLDHILELTLIYNMSPIEILSELEKKEKDKKNITYIIKFFELFSKNQWKRDRQAPSFHLEQGSLDPKTFKRLPLLSKVYKEEIEKLKQLN